MSKTKIKIGFAGTPKVAFDIFREILLSEEISTEFVLTQPDKLSGRGLTTSRSLFDNLSDLPVLQPDDLNEQDLIYQIKDFDIDLLLNAIPKSLANDDVSPAIYLSKLKVQVAFNTCELE